MTLRPRVDAHVVVFRRAPVDFVRGDHQDCLSVPDGRIFCRESGLNWQNMIHEILHQVDQSALSDYNMLVVLDGLDPKRKIDVGTPANPGGSKGSTQISDFIKDKCK